MIVMECGSCKAEEEVKDIEVETNVNGFLALDIAEGSSPNPDSMMIYLCENCNETPGLNSYNYIVFRKVTNVEQP